MIPPLPIIDPLTEPFWTGLRSQCLKLQHCQNCGYVLYPILPCCPRCLGDQLHWRVLSGRGAVVSFGIYHHVFHPWFADKVPYNVALVELVEGPRLITNIVGVEQDRLCSGTPVEAIYTPMSEEVHLLKFRPASL